MLFKRAGAVGSGAFTGQFLSEAYTTRSSARAVTAAVADGAHLAWRDPFKWFPADECFTDIIHAIDTPTSAGVPPVAAPGAMGLGVSPNPLPSGATLNVRLSLARPQTVELALIDIAGRRVAQTETRLDAGTPNVMWTPDGLRAGVYRVVASTRGARIGSAPVIVLR